ncbi:MAG: hypothetical protein JNJ54_37395 [Myxococcaceae bacterium]|nr:hypothetical protein [Myxococcaceae bacterium]
MSRNSLLLALCLSTAASAGEVFVNGVNVDGLTNQTFSKVNVVIDEKGNVHIDAPGYAVKKVTIAPDKASAAVREEGVVTKKYFVVTEQNVLGRTEYDIDLYINGKFIRTLRSDDEQIVSEITRYFVPGKNAVLFQARKVQAHKDQPKSTRSEHFFRVIIGEGSMTADQVTIETPLIKFERTAADVNDVRQEFSVTTR